MVCVLGALLVFFSLTPAVAAQSGTPQGTLTVGLVAEPESMDPYLVYHHSGWAVSEALFDNLLFVDWDGNIVPHLATSWDVVDDTTVEFTLREGVRFHNGEPFDAESVKFSIERILDEELQSGMMSRYESIESVEILDPMRVRLHLTRPDSSILWNLALLAMVPPQYLQEVGDQEFNRSPVGTGPFQFVEWIRDNRTVVEANPDYWVGSLKGKPGVERVVFRTIPEDSTRIAELRAGGIDLMERLPADQVARVEADGKQAVAQDAGRFFVVWMVADAEGPLADQRVRQALNYGVDAEAMIEHLLGGFASRIASPFTQSTLGFNSALEPYPYDPDKARQLLADAGYPNGFSVTMDVTSGRVDLAEAIAGQLGNIGVQAEVRPLELSIFNTNWVNQETNELIAASFGAAGDPQTPLTLLLPSDGLLSRYNNPAVDDLIARSAVTVDADARTAILHELQEILHEDPAAIYLWSAMEIFGVSPAVQNWRPHSTERMVVSNVSIAE